MLDGTVVLFDEIEAGVAVVEGFVVLLAEAGLTGVELAGQALLPTPVEGFFVGMPGILRLAPIHSLSQSTPGFAFESSSNLMPKLSAIL